MVLTKLNIGNPQDEFLLHPKCSQKQTNANQKKYQIYTSMLTGDNQTENSQIVNTETRANAKVLLKIRACARMILLISYRAITSHSRIHVPGLGDTLERNYCEQAERTYLAGL